MFGIRRGSRALAGLAALAVWVGLAAYAPPAVAGTVGEITEFSTGLTPGAVPFGIAAGPDGNLWFTELSGDRIGRITPAGVITEFSTGLTAGAGPLGIAAGPDGNLWFTEFAGTGSGGSPRPG